LFAIDALGVGHKEQAFTWMWCTHGARRDNRPFRIEPEVVKITEDPAEGISVSKESWYVLHDDVVGSYCAYDVCHPRPSPPFVAGSPSKSE
jgi:hypothetical protein